MLVALFGPDALRRKRRLDDLRQQADGGSGMLESNYTLLDGKNAKPEDILGPAMAVPFLAPSRLIVVENFLDRFATGRGGKRSIPENMLSLFDTLETGLPETTILVLTGGEIDPKKNPAVERLRAIDGVSIEDYPAIKARDFIGFVREEAQRQGVRFKPGRSNRPLDPGEEWRRPRETDPAALLAELTTVSDQRVGDTMRAASELEKLAIYANGNPVTVDDVDVLCAADRHSTTWDFVDGCMDADLTKALTAFDYLVGNYYKRPAEAIGPLLGSLLSGYRRIATVIDLLEDGASPDEIGKAIRRPWPNLRDKDIRRARRLGHEGLRAAYETVLEADRSNKQGRVSDGLALEIMVARLAGLAPLPTTS